LRANYRRQRVHDSLASPEAVRSVLDKLRAAEPELIPKKDKDLMSMLRALRHVQRYTASDTKRGRPGRWPREVLLRVGAKLADILDRETSSRVSVASFVDHYLRLPGFPADVLRALTAGEINMFEAAHLARLTSARLSVSPAQAKHVREGILSAHLQTKLSATRLRQRVLEMLRAPATMPAAENGIEPELDLEDFDPYDPTHLFWDQIKQLGFAFREIRREDVTDDDIEELLKASEPILAILNRIQRRKEQSKVLRVKL
jgi:hypothetical protein